MSDKNTKGRAGQCTGGQIGSVHLDEAALRPIIAIVVAVLRPIITPRIAAEVMEQVGDDRARSSGRLGYAEVEAAALLGVQSYVLRDCRLRGEISARRVGKRYVYSRESLEKFLQDGS